MFVEVLLGARVELTLIAGVASELALRADQLRALDLGLLIAVLAGLVTCPYSCQLGQLSNIAQARSAPSFPECCSY